MDGYVKIRSEAYCRDCTMRNLKLKGDQLYADGEYLRIEQFVECEHAPLCARLWFHLLDHDETEDDEQDAAVPDDDPDWSFCSDASYEDRQV